jgi:proline iminopeptidase
MKESNDLWCQCTAGPFRALGILCLMLAFSCCAGPGSNRPSGSVTNEKASGGGGDAQEGDWTIGGTRIHFRMVGEGELVVLLHGGPGGNFQGLKALEELADSYKLVMYDQRGSGQSARFSTEQLNKDPYLIGVDQHVSDLEEVRLKLGVEKLTLLGHDWGGALALFYAIRHPDRVKKLIVYNGGPEWPELIMKQRALVLERLPEERAKEIEAQVKLLSENVAKWEQEKLDQWFANMAKLNVPLLYCHPEAINPPEIGPVGFWANLLTKKYLDDIDIEEFARSLESVTAPVLLTTGKCDSSPVERQTVLRDALPSATMVVFEKSGHHPLIEEKELFVQTVRAFLKDQPLPMPAFEGEPETDTP